MKTLRTAKSMSASARELIASGETLALVPTMGFLHEGHLALVRRAKKHASRVVVSIFVNPTQFGPKEDLTKYPSDQKRDLKLLREMGVDLVYLPKPESVYPEGYATFVDVEGLTDMLEGKSRPGHFRGVTTIVAKLLNVCRPDAVVFGQKDFQQAIVLEKMTRDLEYPIKFVVAPTVREKSGLALSSRNAYFDSNQRAEAACLYYSLKKARKAFKSGETRAVELSKIIKAESKKICPSVDFDYIALTDARTLEPLKSAVSGSIISLAASVHGVRLIDNIKL